MNGANFLISSQVKLKFGVDDGCDIVLLNVGLEMLVRKNRDSFCTVHIAVIHSGCDNVHHDYKAHRDVHSCKKWSCKQATTIRFYACPIKAYHTNAQTVLTRTKLNAQSLNSAMPNTLMRRTSTS